MYTSLRSRVPFVQGLNFKQLYRFNLTSPPNSKNFPNILQIQSNDSTAFKLIKILAWKFKVCGVNVF